MLVFGNVWLRDLVIERVVLLGCTVESVLDCRVLVGLEEK